VLHAWPLAQSVAALHPQVSVAGRHAVPAALPVQSTQAPEPPHAVWLVPGRHEAAVPQQPALQGALVEHVKTQRPEVVSQPALPAGQSPTTMQPHCPPPFTGSHTSPLEPAVKPAVHDEHTPPLLPHVVGSVPIWQVPPVAAEQQPPWQGCDVAHVGVHVPVPVSQALPAGQSAALVHGPGASGGASTLASSGRGASVSASAVASTPLSCPAGASKVPPVSTTTLASLPGPDELDDPKQPASTASIADAANHPRAPTSPC